MTRSRLSIRKTDILAARTVRIVPTVFSDDAIKSRFSDSQRRLVSNAADRTLCSSLSERFRVVPLSEPADLTVHSVVTHIDATNQVAAGASVVASEAVLVATSLASIEAPIFVPRVPIGLGGLSMEAEALSPDGTQLAAMVWAKGANSFTNRPRISPAGDAYELAASFGHDFSRLMLTGKSPFEGWHVGMPTMSNLTYSVGAAPKYAACEAFGRSPGLKGIFGGSLGLPPEWTDKGARAIPAEAK